MELLRQIARQVIISLGFYQAGQIGSELASGTPEMGRAIPGLSGGVGGDGTWCQGLGCLWRAAKATPEGSYP